MRAVLRACYDSLLFFRTFFFQAHRRGYLFFHYSRERTYLKLAQTTLINRCLPALSLSLSKRGLRNNLFHGWLRAPSSPPF